VNARQSLEQRIAQAALQLGARHTDLAHHSALLRHRVVGAVRRSPMVVGAGVALLAWAWFRMRYKKNR
jgi:hypothetical protein